MIVTLERHLAILKESERAKPKEQRRRVPSYAALAIAAGVDTATISRLARGEIESLKLQTGAAILDELRARGFDSDLNDILAYKPKEG